MLNNLKILILSLFFLLASSNAFSQVNLQHDINWQTTNQNMWGPNGSPFNINFDYTLFDVGFDTALTIGSMNAGTGVEFNLAAGFDLGSFFYVRGFTTGWVDAAYPVKIDLQYPDVNTYCPGDIVTMNSGYHVKNGWDLTTYFPKAGEIGLDLKFGFNIDANVVTCVPVVGCDTNTLFQSNVPTDTMHIFYLNGQTGEVVYPCTSGGSFQFCHDTLLPLVFDNLFGTGLSGEITIPYVQTVDRIDSTQSCAHKNMYADGDSTWANFELDIIEFLGFVAQILPPPQGPAIQQFLGMLHGTYDLGLIQIEYDLFAAWMQMQSTMKQNFTFEPTVWTNLTFPTSVEYTVTDPNNSDSIVHAGMSDLVSFEACYDLNFKYPCSGFPIMDVGLSHSLTNDFTNHTWDSLTFAFAYKALEFQITLPFFNALPPTTIPTSCINIPYSCAESTDSTNWCSYQECMPGLTNPPVLILSSTIDIGPLFHDTIPLGYLPLTWYNNTWELAGFQDSVFPSITFATNCPPFEFLSIDGNNVHCNGYATGAVTVQVNNGLPPYTFSWSNGETHITNNTSDSIVNVPEGTYIVTISDSRDCQFIDSIDIVEINPAILINFNITDVDCRGNSTGSILATINGGTPNYTYQWSPSGGSQANTTGLSAGEYILSITDAAGCKTSDTAIVIEPDTALAIVINSTTNILCNQGSNGSIDINVSGGTQPYSYSWSNGSTSQDLNSIIAGNYSVTVTDNHACKASDSIEIIQPASFEIIVDKKDISCFGMIDGSIDLIITGATSPYSFIWSTGASSEDINSLAAGTYSVTITDANGCKAYSTATVIEPTELLATISGVDVACSGVYTGKIDLTVTGGSTPYIYQWSNGAITEDLNNLSGGTYSVTITDDHLCKYYSSITLTEPQTPIQATFAITHVKCFEGADGAIDMTVNGGTPSYTFTWSNSANTEDLSNVSAGTYFVTITDANQCKLIKSNIVNEPGELILTMCNDRTICYGQTVTLCVQQTIGGSLPYTYIWNTGQSGPSIDVNPLTTTTYSAHVLDSKGCLSAEQNIVVNVNPQLSIDVYISRDSVCPGEMVMIGASMIGAANPPVVYLSNGMYGQPPFIVYPTVTTIYTASVFDACNFQSAKDSVLVTVMPSPMINFEAIPNEGCQPMDVQFNELCPENDLTLLWNLANGDISSLENPTKNYPDAGAYDISLTATSDFGCTSKLVKEDYIVVHKKPTAEIDVNKEFVDLLDPVVQFYNYSSTTYESYWNFGDGSFSGLTNPEHKYSDAKPDTFNVVLIAETEYGCKDTAYKNIVLREISTIYTPNAFTPDGDGLNDEFRPLGVGIEKENYHFVVYNRWGEVIFETKDSEQGWDGTFKGELISKNDVYNWIVYYTENTGLAKKVEGFVVILGGER